MDRMNRIFHGDEVEVTISGVFTTHHRMQVLRGALGELTLPALRRDGVFCAADGRELAVRRPHWWRDWHELWEGETVLGTARPQGFFGRRIAVQFRNREYTLQPAGFWTRAWHLADRAGTTLLEIRPRGVFRRGAYVKVIFAVDTALLVLAYYLVHTRWQRESTAAASAASAS
jgi:hypothetical protein